MANPDPYYTITFIFFRVLFFLYCDRDYPCDVYGPKITAFLNKLECISTPRTEKIKMCKDFESFVRLNYDIITVTNSRWCDNIIIEEENELHDALRQTLKARTDKDKDIINSIIDSQRAKFGNETVRAFKVLFLDTYEGTKLLSNYREV